MTKLQMKAIKDCLSNDEGSTDAELFEHFTKEIGVDAKTAQTWINKRDFYLKMEDLQGDR